MIELLPQSLHVVDRFTAEQRGINAGDAIGNQSVALPVGMRARIPVPAQPGICVKHDAADAPMGNVMRAIRNVRSRDGNVQQKRLDLGNPNLLSGTWYRVRPFAVRHGIHTFFHWSNRSTVANPSVAMTRRLARPADLVSPFRPLRWNG